MKAATFLAFDDEMKKIAASLAVGQMLAQEGKGLKRGWDAARQQKSMLRLVNRGAGERKGFYAANKAAANPQAGWEALAKQRGVATPSSQAATAVHRMKPPPLPGANAVTKVGPPPLPRPAP
jgi:hypothetical protein